MIYPLGESHRPRTSSFFWHPCTAPEHKRLREWTGLLHSQSVSVTLLQQKFLFNKLLETLATISGSAVQTVRGIWWSASQAGGRKQGAGWAGFWGLLYSCMDSPAFKQSIPIQKEGKPDQRRWENRASALKWLATGHLVSGWQEPGADHKSGASNTRPLASHRAGPPPVSRTCRSQIMMLWNAQIMLFRKL